MSSRHRRDKPKAELLLSGSPYRPVRVRADDRGGTCSLSLATLTATTSHAECSNQTSDLRAVRVARPVDRRPTALTLHVGVALSRSQRDTREEGLAVSAGSALIVVESSAA